MSLRVRAVRFQEPHTMHSLAEGASWQNSCYQLSHLVSQTLFQKAEQHGAHPFTVDASRRALESRVTDWLSEKEILRLTLDIAPSDSECVRDRYEVTFDYGSQPSAFDRTTAVTQNLSQPVVVGIPLCRGCRLSAVLAHAEGAAQLGWRTVVYEQGVCTHLRDALETWGVSGITARLVHFGPRRHLPKPPIAVRSYRPPKGPGIAARGDDSDDDGHFVSRE